MAMGSDRIAFSALAFPRASHGDGDGDGDGDGWQLVLLGEGEVPVRDTLTLLRTNSHQGWISVEWEKRWHPEIEPPEVALPQPLALLRTWLGEAA